MDKLGKVLPREILDVLRISYNALDGEEQNVLLDIAYLCQGMDRNRATETLAVFRTSVHFSISNLINKSLVVETSTDRLELHDLIRDMCWGIVNEQSVVQHRTRLQNPEDVRYVLMKKKGTDLIEGICLDISKARRMHLDSDSFVGMDRLRFLKFYSAGSSVNCKEAIHLPSGGLQYLSDVLSYLHWEDFPSKCLATNFCAENLVDIILTQSKLKRLWKGKQINQVSSAATILPGSEIPQWFHCQSEGPLVTMKLPSNCGGFSRIFFCAVLSGEEPKRRKFSGLTLFCGFENAKGDTENDAGNELETLEEVGYSDLSTCTHYADALKLDHLVQWYTNKFQEFFNKFRGEEVCFEFKDPAKYSKVKRCGVCIIYDEMDGESFGNSSKRSSSNDPEMGTEGQQLKRPKQS
ncbi:hypothetical protein Tsubulata_050586, partial [Turnera subulata]